MAYSCCVVYLLCLCSLLININGVKSDEDDFSVKNCYQKAERGICMAYMQRWYYNSTWNNCTKFIYGGCRGNKNRFESREECEEKCLNVISQMGNSHQSSHDGKPTPDGPCTKKVVETKQLLSVLPSVLASHFRHIPDCDENGYYKPMQCKHKGLKCWCVDRWGNRDKRHKQRKSDELDCS